MIGDRPEVHAFQTHELTARWTPSASTRLARAGAATIRVELARVGGEDPGLAREECLLYFNNDWEGFAPRNALRLRRLLGAQPPD